MSPANSVNKPEGNYTGSAARHTNRDVTIKEKHVMLGYILSGIFPTFTCKTSQVKDYAGRKIEIEREARRTSRQLLFIGPSG